MPWSRRLLGTVFVPRWPRLAALASGMVASLAFVVSAPGQNALVRWIAVGGGPDPRSTQVSLEQDMALARKTLGPAGVLLFAGGSDAHGVQVLDDAPRGDSLLRELGDLFDPLDGRDSHYRRPAIEVDGPASATRLHTALTAVLEHGTAPLLLYVAGHGDKGEAPAENSISLWGDGAVTVEQLADLLDQSATRREVRLVITSCYSGGFAELAFAGASADHGPATGKRCGLFAAEWDQEASGCDPDPDRGRQEGYGIHFWHALRGQDRDGKPLPLATLDLDHDGKISLLEAHTRARIASGSIDTPTSTSERWLRQATAEAGPIERVSWPEPVALPEEDAVIAALGARLTLSDEAAARRRSDELWAALLEADDALARADDDEREAYSSLRIGLLERWPVLDDPWHPDFAATVREHRAGIRSFLREGTAARAHRAAADRLSRAEERVDVLQQQYAPVRRLARAYETRALAARLRAAGGPAWDYYEELLTCERGVP